MICVPRLWFFDFTLSALSPALDKSNQTSAVFWKSCLFTFAFLHCFFCQTFSRSTFDAFKNFPSSMSPVFVSSQYLSIYLCLSQYLLCLPASFSVFKYLEKEKRRHLSLGKKNLHAQNTIDAHTKGCAHVHTLNYKVLKRIKHTKKNRQKHDRSLRRNR